MKKLIMLLIIGMFTLSGIPQTASAGPWTLKQGKVWSEVFTRYFLSKHYFDPKGKRHRWSEGGYSEIWDIEGKVEYGVTDDFNLLLGIPYTWTRWSNDWHSVWDESWGPNEGRTHREGFKQISIGGKYRITEDPIVTAIQAKFFFDPESEQVASPDLYEYGRAFELRALAGRSFTIDKKLVYTSFEGGYKWNGGKYANSFPVFAEVGFAPLDRFMVKGEIDCNFSHNGTGYRKDSVTWRSGVIFNLLGKGFNSIEKGGDSSLNLELQYGQTAWGRGDGREEKFSKAGQAQELIFKVQALF